MDLLKKLYLKLFIKVLTVVITLGLMVLVFWLLESDRKDEKCLRQNEYDVFDEFMADNSWKFYKYSDYTNDYVKCSMSSNELRICGLLFKGGASHFFKNGIDELIVYIMQNDRLEDLSFCKGLPIVSLCVWSCDKLVDISVLNELPLKNIELSHLNICDISALDGLPLKQLKIEKCPVKDIEVLKNCHTLCRVTLKNVPVVEFDALNGLKLDTVVLDGTRGRDLSSFLKIESLKYFNVGCGKIRCVDCE